MKKYESTFLTINYDSEHALLEFLWHPSSKDLDNATLKEEFLAEVELCNTYKPKKLLINTKSFNYAITPELQEWTDENIFPKYLEAGVTKIAIVVSQDFISSISVEQTMGEEKGKSFDTQYFDNDTSAKEWLLAD